MTLTATRPHLRRLCLPALLCPLLAWMTGCSTSGVNVSLDTWKESVEQHVREVGKGDPVVLRDAAYKGRPAFAQIGHPVPSEGTDAIGILLGHRPILGRPSFIYLVGLVPSERVEDIRIAVLQPITSQGGETQFKWLMSPPNAESLRKYMAFRQELYRTRFPGGGSPPPAYTSFPAEEDAFDLAVAPDRVTVTHPPSAAQWNLSLSGTGAAR
jgi:hypothetical protein